MGNCCSDAPPGTWTLAMLQDRLEGARHKVSEQPEVWVTLRDLVFQETDTLKFDLALFNVKDLFVKTVVEIAGSTRQIVQVLGDEAALKLIDKVGVERISSKIRLDQDAKTQPRVKVNKTSLIEVKVKPPSPNADRVGVGFGSWEKEGSSRKFSISVCFELARDSDAKEVIVQVGEMRSEEASAPQGVLRSDGLQRLIKQALLQSTCDALNLNAEKL
ncbi:unnamed protein product [Polarella glacialis]|uniref:Uncharacterized protein n=1 Tax=Polarella glacialis TaxID=89957 RepID=A0A813JY20_POLGL|nr:unnamed protein product [Polarella glacialis]|mmetsp:Transcript_75146/g.135358  ORF Transcript_75146/g.135358 Transcript_75146/m.135358 type:complete len:217 (-) Transcript_75146:78-728(-)